MISIDYANILREQVGERIDITNDGPDRMAVYSPFTFLDGDQYTFYLERDPDGGMSFTDEGDIVNHVNYSGIDLLSTGRFEKLKKLAEFYGASLNKGVLTLPVKDNDIGGAFFRFSQVCLEASRLSWFRPEQPKRKRSSIRDRLYETLIKVSPFFKPGLPNLEKYDPHGIYPVDYTLHSSDKQSQVLVYGIASDRDSLGATVSSYHYKRAYARVKQMAIYGEEYTIKEKSVLQLSEAGSKVFPETAVDEIAHFVESN